MVILGTVPESSQNTFTLRDFESVVIKVEFRSINSIWEQIDTSGSTTNGCLLVNGFLKIVQEVPPRDRGNTMGKILK